MMLKPPHKIWFSRCHVLLKVSKGEGCIRGYHSIFNETSEFEAAGFVWRGRGVQRGADGSVYSFDSFSDVATFEK